MCLLGRIEARAGDAVVIDRSWPRRKVLALLKLLALQPGRALHREQVLEKLWPELTPAAAARNLRKSVHYLRAAFAEHRVEGSVVSLAGEMVVLCPEVRLDIDEFKERAREARAARTDPTLYEEALSLYAGDLLPEDLYEDWTEPARDELRGLRNRLLLELCELWELRGQLEPAIERLQELLGADPANESAHRSLMRLFTWDASRERALRQYRYCRDVLERELGVKPSEETEALRRDIEEGRLPAARAGGTSRTGRGSFVGRRQELDELRAGLEDAFAGRGRAFLIAGEPGAGKSRTSEEFADYAALRGADVLWGPCYGGDGAPAYWPWLQIIRASLLEDDWALQARLGAGGAFIAQLLPELRERLPGLPEPPALEPDQARFQLFSNVSEFLKRAGARRPQVLILDDLQWADKPTLLLLQFLVRDMRQARLFLIGTYREAEGARQPLAQTLAELNREQQSGRLILSGLSEEEVARFIELASTRTPPEGLAARVQRETEGNPFFVKEVVRLLLSGGHLDQPSEVASRGVPVPQSVREVIGLRLGRLSRPCREVLTVASVAGREFDRRVLEIATGHSGDSLLEALDEASAAHIVAEVPGEVGRYAFSHTLIRETLYDETSAVSRERLHRLIGEALEASYGADADRHVEELAYHFFRAAPVGATLNKAVDYAARAGRAASARVAHEEAVAHFQMALQALGRREQDQPQRCELLLELGWAHWWANQPDEAKAVFVEAAGVARAIGAPDQLARAALGSVGRQQYLFALGLNDESVTDLLTEAVAAIGPGDSGLRAQLLVSLALALYRTATLEERRDLCREAVAMARRTGDPLILRYVLDQRGWALQGVDEPEELLVLAQEQIQIEDELDLPRWGHIWRFMGLLYVGEMASFDAELAAWGDHFMASYRAMLLAMRAIFDGRLAEAERLVAEAFELGQRERNLVAIGAYGTQLVSLRREQGRLAELDEMMPAMSGPDDLLRFVVPLFHCDLGRPDDARAAFERLAASDFTDVPQDVHWLSLLMPVAEACAALGDVRRAALLYDMLLPHAQRDVVAFMGVLCTGPVTGYLGVLAAALSRWAEAARHFDDALDRAARMGARPYVTRMQYEYAAMLFRRGAPGDKRKGHALLACALETGQALGMRHLADAIESLRAPLGEGGC